MTHTFEVNFDGLVGPTHNYAGLSHGNVASKNHARSASHPKLAALQGLEKMKTVRDMGLKQALLPPHARPAIHELRKLGFSGNTAQVIEQAYKHSPALLANFYSASNMWTANAATVSPSADSADGKVHFTPANLANKLHRSIEPETTGLILQRIFHNEQHFTHHAPLPPHDAFGDEGAANHTRLAPSHGEKGVELFVYGKKAFDPGAPAPRIFPARHTLEASQAVARSHGLHEKNTVFAQQNPDVIDKGVFHNDVIAVGNGTMLFYHEQAFLDAESMKAELAAKFAPHTLHFAEIKNSDVTVEEAVSTYLFNSQLLTLPDGSMTLVAPQECEENQAVAGAIRRIIEEGETPLKAVRFLDVRESMKNGGGPACLRLRVALTRDELKAMHEGVMLTDELYTTLMAWVEKHYRDTLHPDDLRDPKLAEEAFAALDELTQILDLGSIYPFQW